MHEELNELDCVWNFDYTEQMLKDLNGINKDALLILYESSENLIIGRYIWNPILKQTDDNNNNNLSLC